MKKAASAQILASLVLCISCAREATIPQIDLDALANLLKYHADLNHVKVGRTFNTDLQQSIQKAGDCSLVYCDVDGNFSIQMRKLDSGEWIPEGFIRRVLPDRNDYPDLSNFMAARCDYFASQWILNHQGVEHFYCPDCPPVRKEDGTWWTETGQAVISGPGLNIILNTEGELLKIREIFNPD